MRLSNSLLVGAGVASHAAIAAAQRGANVSLLTDPGVKGPELEIAHLYYDQWPTGVAVSSTGRIFSNYPPGLDAGNTNNGTNGKYTVAELTGLDQEVPYPSAEFNNPPGGAINYTTSPPSGANYQDHFIGVQSVVIDSQDRLWVLDTGRAIDPKSGEQVLASYGGPKLVGIDLSTDSVFQTIIFPSNVAFPDSYLNDVRFDLRSDIPGGNFTAGVAYITDSSTEGRNGIIIVDLATGESWRHVSLTQAVRSDPLHVPYVWGEPVYYLQEKQLTYLPLGSDGIALSADGEDLFFGPLGSRYLYSVPTKLLRARGPTSEILAQQGVVNRGQKGMSDGFETDSNGLVYVGQFEQNAVAVYNPQNGTSDVFVRDPRINWVDTMSVATDGYLYFTVNQLNLSPGFYPGVDRRVKPWALFKTKLPNGGTKVVPK